jgi:PHD/YefM family antitoxin component YafN of YafNO toxin-antitoxin module
MKVSTAEFIKNYGTLADKALTEPITITKNGRDRFVFVKVEEFERLMRRNRRVVHISEFTDEEMDMIEKQAMEPGDEHLNAELEGWTP